jgi:hypothetical protein
MLRNYLIVGLRALAKNKTYAFINIFGLALGLAASILILSYVRYEFSYDAWMPGSDRAYELQTIFHATQAGGVSGDSQTTAYKAGQAFKKDFPQFDRVVYATGQNAIYIQNGQPTTTKNTVLTDGPLFDVLQVPFVRGYAAHALDDPHSLVLSESEAKKRFGDDNPIGRTLTVVSGTMNADYRVTGVFKDIPKNSSFAATTVVRIDPQLYYRDAQGQLSGAVTSWRWQNGQIFARAKPGVRVEDIEAQFPAWKKRNIPDDLGPGPKSNPGNEEDFRLVNIRDVHIGQSKGPAVTTDRMTVLTFAIVAFMILAMACINFTNLSTARASQATDHAVHRGIDAGVRNCDADRAGAGGTAAASAQRVPGCADQADLFRRQRRVRVGDPADPVRGSGGWGLSRFLPLALRARAHPAGQQVVERCAWQRTAAHLARDHAIRGFDRADHLHRGSLCANNIRALGRRRLSPRRADPDPGNGAAAGGIGRQCPARRDQAPA